MNKPGDTYDHSLDFVVRLRQAITVLGEVLPAAEAYLKRTAPAAYHGNAGILRSTACRLMDQFIAIADCLKAADWPQENRRMSMSRGRTFVDDWPLDYSHPLTDLLASVDTSFLKISSLPSFPDGRALDDAAHAAIASYLAWRSGWDEEERLRRSQWSTKREAAAPPHREMPHRPDPPSVMIAGEYSARVLDAWRSDAVATAQDNRQLADAHLIRGLVDHWLLRDPAQVRSDLSSAAERMALALPTVQIHAWEYEQWQHLAIVVAHRGLLDALWALRREEWDTNRIRPVNWLICRIRILDLLHQGGSEAELRGLLEMSWIGLFADPLPPELAVDTPLMRNWHELLRAILDRDTVAFDRHLVLRQVQLAAHWTRGGGIAPLSLADLGGLALVRTARARGLTPATPGLPYLAFDLLLS